MNAARRSLNCQLLLQMKPPLPSPPPRLKIVFSSCHGDRNDRNLVSLAPTFSAVTDNTGYPICLVHVSITSATGFELA